MSANKNLIAADLNKTKAQLIEELRNSQSLLQMVCDSIPMEIYVKDHEGRYLVVNKKAQNISGLKADDFRGKIAIDAPYGTKEDRAGFSAEDHQVLSTGKDMRFPEQIVTHPDGRVVVKDVIKMPLKNDNGTVVGLVGTAIDITERKQAEEELLRTQTLMRTVFDAIPAGISVRDTEGRYTMANSATASRYGFTPEEIVGRWPSELGLPSELDEEFNRYNLEVFETGKTIVFPELYINFPNEESGWRQITKAPLHDAQGEIIGVVGVGIDITERVRAEEALRESEARFRSVIDNSPSAIFLRDLEGRYSLVNRVLAERFGLLESEMIGKTAAEVLPGEFAQQVNDQEAETRKTREVNSREHILPSRDGTERIVLTTKFPVMDAEGNIESVGTISTDITELKRAEDALRESQELFRNVIDNSPHAILLKDLEGRYTLVNRVYAEQRGVPEGEIVGKRSSDFFPHDLVDQFTAQTMEVLETGKVVEREFVMQFPDNIQHTIVNTQFPVNGSDGKMIGVGTIAMDITGQRRVEEQLRESQKMEAVGQLAGGIAHEFNNNLQIIVNGVQFAKNNIRNPEMVEEFLGMTLKSAERSAELTKQLLAYSRKTPLIPKAIDLNELITDLTWLVRPIIGADIEIEFDPAGDLLPVVADDGMIKQSLINLCINARDAMPDGGRLMLETRNHHADQEFCDLHGCKQPGDYAMISVIDTGVGMTSEIRERIFEPFFTTKEVGQGTGLGLAMVHGIVQQHDGAIEALSEPGAGSTFNIYLPKADSQVERKKAAAVGNSPRGSETILVAEDEADVRGLLARMLESKGYQVLPAQDGEEAMAVFKANAKQIGLIILDMIMPKLSGREVFEQIRESGSDVPVLFSSGYSLDASDAEFASDRGLPAIQKPYASEVLFSTVREILDEQ